MKAVDIEDSWKLLLKDEFDKPYFRELTTFVRSEYLTKTIYPHPKDVFSAFRLTPVEKVSVVILGQDPYHGPDQAHGLSFSVRNGVHKPPSLQNIFKEIISDVGAVQASSDLTSWAQQGVLLLNATLTVEKGKAGSHQSYGWEQFTDAVIHALSEKQSHIVFILWGKYAQKKKILIDTSKHLVLESAHPSPLSAHNGFFGCKHFSRTNDYLIAHDKNPILW
jgi:uracil-DNA glycosylase